MLMPTPSEHKTVQARILAYAEAIGWTFVPRNDAEHQRGFDPDVPPADRAKHCSLFFNDLLDAKVREFNPRYDEAAGVLLGRFRHLDASIYGNREFVRHLRNRSTFSDHEEQRERDLILIDYDDPTRNVYHVTEEWAFHNGRYGTREDVVFLINGIPVLAIECKNAGKDEAIDLGVEQIRRYHRETPELFVPEQIFTATDVIGFSYGVSWNTVRRNIFDWKGERVFQPVGFENTDRNVRAPFYDPDSDIDEHRRNLPHWQQGGVWIFVTWRLGDSLPKVRLDQWKEERAIWLSLHPEPWDRKTEAEYHDRFSQQIDEWLDQGSGSCVLREPANANIVAEALRYFDGERYEIASFVVMPNHVHVLFRLLGDHALAEILKSWKGFTTREINRRSGKTGSLWQDEYWDRLIRNERHFFKVKEYIRENPVKAGLREGEFVLGEGGVYGGGLFGGEGVMKGGEEGELKRGQEGGQEGGQERGQEGGLNGGQECPPSGTFEDRVKSFCAVPQVLAFLKDYIVFAEKDEELNKYILRQHQTGAVDASVGRALESGRTRGLVWHTQGSGKTFTMIKTAERLFRAPEADKPTVLLMIDRNELEDQMLKNLAALGLGNLEHAGSIARLSQLLKDDYRGIVVTMIHKFRDMPANLNTRANIYVLIDEAHRTTGGDLGNFLMAGLPNATFLGFTGTPVDKTVYGRGTFKTFGCEDDQGYLHKYSIADSIRDGTTLTLYYQLAPNEMLVPHETLDREFLSLAEAEGVSDIEALNKILERAVNLKNFLKGKKRIQQVARFVARHYRENVEPLGYKAFLVGVDREACAHYKRALDQLLPHGYSEVVYTGSNNDSKLLKRFHLDPNRERQIRKSFGKIDQQPKILIVTEKLLTGFDAPVLYAMYLDKPMRDHTLLQAIARVNRPYENEALGMKKPHGFVLDFIGIFDKLEKALAFDSEEINAIVKDLNILKTLFRNTMEQRAPGYIGLIKRNFDDRDVDALIEHFRDPARRKEFFKVYKDIEMLYEIISPDAFMGPFIDDYRTLSAIYHVVCKAYSYHVTVDRDFQKKTNQLVREHVGCEDIERVDALLKIDDQTIEYIQAARGGEATKVINLVKSIERQAGEDHHDLNLVAMAERAQTVREKFENRQISTAGALAELQKDIGEGESRKKEQAEKGLDGLGYFVYRTLDDAGIGNADTVSRKIRQALADCPHWNSSENALRELRTKVTLAIHAEVDDPKRGAAMVDTLLTLLKKAG